MWGFLFVLGGLFLLSNEGYTLLESYLYFDDLLTTGSKEIPAQFVGRLLDVRFFLA